MFWWIFPLMQLLLKRTLERPHWREHAMFMGPERCLAGLWQNTSLQFIKWNVSFFHHRMCTFPKTGFILSFEWELSRCFTCKAHFSQEEGIALCQVPLPFSWQFCVLAHKHNTIQSKVLLSVFCVIAVVSWDPTLCFWDLSSYSSFCSLQKINNLFPSKFMILIEFRLSAH